MVTVPEVDICLHLSKVAIFGIKKDLNLPHDPNAILLAICK